MDLSKDCSMLAVLEDISRDRFTTITEILKIYPGVQFGTNGIKMVVHQLNDDAHATVKRDELFGSIKKTNTHAINGWRNIN